MRKQLFLAILAVVTAVALAAGGTLALFTDTTTSTENDFTAGTLSLGNQDQTTWSADYDDMAPGDTVTKTIRITNTGSLGLKFYPKIPATGGDLFTGSGKAIVNINYSDYDLAPGEFTDVAVEVTLPLAAGNAYQAKSGTLSLTFFAFQTKNLVPEAATSALLSTADPTWNKYEFRDSHGVRIDLVPATVLAFVEIKPTGQARSFDLVPGDPYFWFSKSRPAGTYTYEIIGVNGQQYTATINH